MIDKKNIYKSHLIVHTHWDREWYESMELYRFRLIKVFERLKKIFASDAPAYHSFFLDGQTVVLDDYLEVRKEDEQLIREWVKSGRLRIGPFHTLLDEQLVSGESYIRNLIIGLATVEEYGGTAKTAYFPDNFGHISQTPQILKGFDIDVAVIMRGIEKDENTPPEGYWKGADGSKVKALLLLCGYGSICGCDPGNENSFKHALNSIDDLKKRTKFNTLLLMHGIDHSLPQSDIQGVIDTLQKIDPEVEIAHSDFESYVAAIPWKKVEYEICGEQIKTPFLDGTFSSRMALKIMNRESENMLTGYAEPLSALAWLEGADYPAQDLKRAWRHLTQSHIHDSITGCHSDSVADDMRNRLFKSFEMGKFIAERGMDNLAGETYDYQNPAESKIISIFNPSPFERSEVVRMDIFLPPETDLIRSIRVTRGGESYEAAIVAIEEVCWPLRSDYSIPNRILHKRLTIEFGPVKLAPFTSNNFNYELKVDETVGDNFLNAITAGSEHEKSQVDIIHRGGNVLENEFVKLEVFQDATIDVTDKQSGNCFEEFHRIEVEMDSGNLYVFAPLLKRTRYYLTPTSISLEEDLPTSASIKVTGHIDAPAGIAPDMTPLEKKARCLVDVVITLKKGDPVIHFKTKLDSALKQVCLRTVFDSGLKNAVNHVNTPFDIVERPPLSDKYICVDKRQTSSDVNRYCALNFTSITDGENGFALLNRGLPEYTFHKDGIMTLTLLRSSNLIYGTGKTDFPLKEFPSEGGFELGRHEREYGLLLHSGSLIESERVTSALAYNSPIRPRLHATPPSSPFGMRFNTHSIIFSALKLSENGECLVLRFYNALAKEQTAEIAFDRELLKAFSCRIDETINYEIEVDKGKRVKINVKAKEIITLKLFFRRTEKNTNKNVSSPT